MPRVCFAQTNRVDSLAVHESSELRRELDAATDLLSSTLPVTAQKAANASAVAYQRQRMPCGMCIKILCWEPRGQQLDLLEIYVKSDSRLTDRVQSLGGRAQRFIIDDGDLATAEGQRKLWDLLQYTSSCVDVP